MKKALIAGAASVALAAMPVVGVFADAITTVEDTLTVTVSESCEFGTSTSGTAGSGANANKKTNSYTAVGNQAPGALVELGDTTLAIKCNNVNGYKITPTMTSLTDTDSSDGTGTAITYSDTTAEAESGTWSATYTLTHGGVAQTPDNFADGTAVTGNSSMTDTYSIHYKIGLGADQEAATYSGTATYVLATNV